MTLREFLFVWALEDEKIAHFDAVAAGREGSQPPADMIAEQAIAEQGGICG